MSNSTNEPFRESICKSAHPYSLAIAVAVRTRTIHTHYHNRNLIWRTVSRRVDEVIPRRARSVEGDPMVWPHPRDVIRYARSSYYYDNMFIICLF